MPLDSTIIYEGLGGKINTKSDITAIVALEENINYKQP